MNKYGEDMNDGFTLWRKDTVCGCRRCLKDDPGGCLTLEAIHADQVRRGVIPADQYAIGWRDDGSLL